VSLPITNDIPEQRCPYCGNVLNRSTRMMGDGVPDKDDVSLCIRCGGLTVYTEDRSLRRPSIEELAEIKASDAWPEIEKLRRGIDRINTNRKRNDR
jgi:hypothetical protein